MLSSATKDNATNLRNDIKLTTESLKEDAKALNKKGVQTATEIAHDAGVKAREYFESANEHIADFSDKMHDEIKANPVRSALTALGVGFVLGLLLSR